MNLFKFLLILGILCFHQSYAQELKTKKKLSEEYLEEYTVLKKDKKIKHGRYIKYRLDFLDNKSVLIIGQFNKGQKTGGWFYFYPNGQLKDEGGFDDDQKQGFWRHYYYAITEKPSLQSIIELNKSLIFKDDGSIEIDKSDLKISSEGAYRLGTKVGLWNYYSEKQQLLQTYDHSSQKLISNHAPDSIIYTCPYLGGIERFTDRFLILQRQLNTDLPSSNVVINLKLRIKPSSFSVEIVNSIGDREYIKSVVNTIKMMDNDFLLDYIDSEDNALLLKAEYLKQEDWSRLNIEFIN